MRWAFAGALLLGSGGCTLQMECTNAILSDAPAPDGRHRIVTFDRNCGATTAISTQVSVLAPGESLEGSGNVFSIDGAFGPGRLTPRQGQALEVHWVDPRTVEVRYDARARTGVPAARAGEIVVRYRADSARIVRPDT
jgi:hypothetical protein